MTISYNWLSQYLPKSLTLAQLSSILTSIGLEVEGTEIAETVKGGLQGLVVGEVLDCVQHPNADKLKITTVNVGAEAPLQIVCGAANVAAGQKVVVACVGATVHPVSGEPFAIKKAKIRGTESSGMICAEDEIGLGESHEGIMVLDADATVGMPAAEYFKLPPSDTAIHIGLTPNRSDAMSHLGVARDVCAYLNFHEDRSDYRPKMPAVADFGAVGNSGKIKISIKENAADACLRYAGAYLKNVRVAPSPEWLKSALQTIGVRSINNVVDITNYVLHEYGQPLHAFDADKIAGAEINVSFLPEQTPFVGLDEKERKLSGEDLMICDAEKPLCMAGVFGGNNSGVTDSTVNLFLESAYFAPGVVRKTSLRHALRTDAALHFEKGADIENVLPALQRAVDLICQITGAALDGNLQETYPKPLERAAVTATYKFIRSLSGKEYSAANIKKILTALGFEITSEDEDGFTLLVPSNKTDVRLPADLVEEVLRIDGLDNIAIPTRLNMSLVPALPNDRRQREKVAEYLAASGFQEIVTNSISNSAYYPECENLVRMINSLNSELDALRPVMLQSGLEVAAYNINRKNKDLMLFEFGNVYATKPEGGYTETPVLAAWVCGSVRESSWMEKAMPASMFYVRGLMDGLLSLCGIRKTVWSDKGAQVFEWTFKNELLARAEKVPAKTLQQFDIKQEVFHLAVQWRVWTKAMQQHKIVYKELPKHPAVKRDLALVLDKSVKYEAVKALTENQKLQHLVAFELFDVFESEKLGADKKSYALNYTFQDNEKTLTDKEIDGFMSQLTDAYAKQLNAQIRS